jgi:hypothetical protein
MNRNYQRVAVAMLEVESWDDVRADIRDNLDTVAKYCEDVGGSLVSRQLIATIITMTNLLRHKSPNNHIHHYEPKRFGT